MDEILFTRINQGWAHPGLDAFFGYLSSYAGFGLPLLALLLAALAWRWRAEGLKLGLALILVVAAGEALGHIVKDLLQQPRPCHAAPTRLPPGVECRNPLAGLPSNHALNYFAAAAFLGLALRRRAAAATLFAVAALVALSRVYLGLHYPSQALAGAALGAALGSAAAAAATRCLPFLRRRRPRR
jgi:undecaprenyl-diphosphatase